MSIHIQTALGLIEVSGSITQEKIISALGYVPVNPKQLENILDDESNNLKIIDPNGNIIVEINRNGVNTTEVVADGVSLKKTLISHINDNTKHITAAERAAWDAKPDSYSKLPGAPAIRDDEGDAFQVADSQGNVAFQVDTEGAKAIDFRMGDISTWDHITTGDMHITPEERNRWNLATDYNNLTNTPPISIDDDASFSIADPDGNKVLEIDENGIRTTKVTALESVANFAQFNQLNINGVNFTGNINSINGIPSGGYTPTRDFNQHDGNNDIHVTPAAKNKWDNTFYQIVDPDNYPLAGDIITLEVGKLDRYDGSERDGEGGLRTPDFIQVTPGEKIYPVFEELKGSDNKKFCFILYNSSQKYISTLWNDGGYPFINVPSGGSFTIPSGVEAAYMRAYISVNNTEGTLTLHNSNSTVAEHKKIYIADHGYDIYGDEIDDPTMHKLVIRALGLDDNSYNITEIKAPTANPEEATLALMNWGNGRKQFVDFSSMTYNPEKPTVEIVCQTRSGEPLPEFSVRYNDGKGAGRVKKFAVTPDCIPIKLTSTGIEVRRNNNYDNDATDEELVTVNLADLQDKVNVIYNALIANGTITK